MSSKIDSPVKIRKGIDRISSTTPISVPTLLRKASSAAPKHPALAFKRHPKERSFCFISFE